MIEKRRSTRFIVIHCSATSPEQDIGVKEITEWHKKKGFYAIGYHYVIRRDGSLEIGRKIDLKGAHCRGYNSTSIGICLIGGYKRLTTSEGHYIGLEPDDNFTEAQFISLKAILKLLKSIYTKASIMGHRQLNPNKDCPCFSLSEHGLEIPKDRF